MVQIPVAAAEASSVGQSAEPEQSGLSLGSAEPQFSVFPPAEGVSVEGAVSQDSAVAADELATEAAQEAAAEQTREAGIEFLEGVGEAVAADPSPPPIGAEVVGMPPAEAVASPAETAPTEAAPPAEAATTPPATTEKTTKSREDLMKEAAFAIADIGVEIDDIRSRMAADKKRLKHLLEDLEEASQKLRDLRDGKEIQQELPLVDGKADGKAGGSDPSDQVTGGDERTAPTVAEILASDAPAPQASPPANEDLSWRKVSIEELNLGDIKGFGKKKQEALAEVAPTLGHLEDLRAQAGPMGLQSVLPNGFGEKICSEIEDKIIAWLSKNRDRAVLDAAAVNGSAPGSAEDYAAVTAEITGPQADQSDWPKPIGDELAAKEEGQKRARAIELQELLANGQLQFEINKEIARNGKDAADNGEGLEACNWTEGDNQDSWLVGYLSVKSVE